MSSSPASLAITGSERPSVIHRSKERTIEFGRYTQEVVTSLAWLWPIRGILYTITHPRILASVRGALLKSLLLSTGIFTLVSLFTYAPQAALLCIITGPLGPILALILVSAETFLLLSAFARHLFLRPALAEVFDATLRAQGQEKLVLEARKPSSRSGRKGHISKAIIRPLKGFTFDRIIRYLIAILTNSVPIAGTVFLFLYNGNKGGPGWHSRYFQLKHMDQEQKHAFIDRRQPEYTAFGAMTLLLNLVPFVNVVFSFTNTVGAALWASEVEAQTYVVDGPIVVENYIDLTQCES